MDIYSNIIRANKGTLQWAFLLKSVLSVRISCHRCHLPRPRTARQPIDPLAYCIHRTTPSDHMSPPCTSSATASRLVMADIKQRLIKLGMMDLDEEQLPQAPHPPQPEPTSSASNSKREAPISVSAPASPSATGGNSPLDSPEAIRAKILQALNSPSRADAVVPASGSPGTLKAVFIKSTSDDISSKLSIIEETATSESGIIQKSSILGEEVLSMTMAREDASVTPIGAPSMIADISSISPSSPPTTTMMTGHDVMASPASPPPAIKSPQGVRRLQSWLSYFYSSTTASKATLTVEEGTGKVATIIPASPPNSSDHQQLPSPPSSPETLEESPGAITDPILEEINQMLAKRPTKGILKVPKELASTLDFPPPIQKSAFLRQEEVLRLSQFAERYQSDSLTEESGVGSTYMSIDEDGHCTVHMRRRSGPLRRRRLKFDMERVRYHQTYGRGDYERGGVEYIAKSLTPEVAMMIKRELNEVKREMPIHEESRHYTQFYQLR